MTATIKLSLTAAQITELGKFIANGSSTLIMHYMAKVLPNDVFIAYAHAHTDIIATLVSIGAAEREIKIATDTCKQLNDIGPESIWQKYRDVERGFWAVSHILAHAKARLNPKDTQATATQYLNDVNADALAHITTIEAPFRDLLDSVRSISLPALTSQYRAAPPSKGTRSYPHFDINDGYSPVPPLGETLVASLRRKMPDRRTEMPYLAFLHKRPTYREISCNARVSESAVACTCKNAIVIYDDYIIDYAAHGSLIAIQNLVASVITNGISLDAFDPTKFYPQHWEVICSEYREKSI